MANPNLRADITISTPGGDFNWSTTDNEWYFLIQSGLIEDVSYTGILSSIFDAMNEAGIYGTWEFGFTQDNFLWVKSTVDAFITLNHPATVYVTGLPTGIIINNTETKGPIPPTTIWNSSEKCWSEQTKLFEQDYRIIENTTEDGKVITLSSEHNIPWLSNKPANFYKKTWTFYNEDIRNVFFDYRYPDAFSQWDRLLPFIRYAPFLVYSDNPLNLPFTYNHREGTYRLTPESTMFAPTFTEADLRTNMNIEITSWCLSQGTNFNTRISKTPKAFDPSDIKDCYCWFDEQGLSGYEIDDQPEEWTDNITGINLVSNTTHSDFKVIPFGKYNRKGVQLGSNVYMESQDFPQAVQVTHTQFFVFSKDASLAAYKPVWGLGMYDTNDSSYQSVIELSGSSWTHRTFDSDHTTTAQSRVNSNLFPINDKVYVVCRIVENFRTPRTKISVDGGPFVTSSVNISTQLAMHVSNINSVTLAGGNYNNTSDGLIKTPEYICYMRQLEQQEINQVVDYLLRKYVV